MTAIDDEYVDHDSWTNNANFYADTSEGFGEDQQEHLEIEPGYAEGQGLVDAINQGTVSVPYSGDLTALAHVDEQDRVNKEVQSEKSFEALNDRLTTRVSINASRQVRFRTYVITAAMGSIRILDDKDKRGDTVINIVSGGPISVGCTQGIQVLGADTAQVATARKIRTQDELWAVSGVNCTFDVQEEFD